MHVKDQPNPSDLVRKQGSKPLHRSLEATDIQVVDQASRTVQIAWASEFGDTRWFGTEILDCQASSIRLGRLQNGAALLFNHCTDDLIGVVESVEIGSDRICRAKVRFDTCEEAEIRYQQVLNKVLTKVSVGYRIYAMVLESKEEDDCTYRITDWEPYELSMVTVPFDDGIGVGRSAQADEPPATLPPASIPPQPKGNTMEPTLTDEAKRQAELNDALNKLSANDIDVKRRDAIVELGVKYSEYLTLNDIQDACRTGKTMSQVQDIVMEKMKSQHSDTRGAHVGLNDKEAQTFSIAKAVRSLISGDWKDAGLERSASEAAGKKFNMASRGFLIPMDVFSQRTFIAGTAAEAGNLVPTNLRTDLFVDVLRNQLVLGKLGCTMLYGLTGNVDIPKKTSGSALAFLTEIAAMSATNPATGKISLTPKRIGNYIDFSKQAVIQSAMAIEPLLRNDIMSEYLIQVEQAAINGTGAGANPRGIRATSGIGSVAAGANGLAPLWSHVVDLESACANVNSEPDTSSGYLLNTKTRGKLKQIQKATNLQFIWDNGAQPLNGYRGEVSNVMPSNLTKGASAGICSSMLFGSNWSSSVIGTFGAVEILLDEVTQASTGLNRLIMNAFMDHGVRRAADFASIDDLLAG